MKERTSLRKSILYSRYRLHKYKYLTLYKIPGSRQRHNHVCVENGDAVPACETSIVIKPGAKGRKRSDKIQNILR